jgi:hypothetical protein
MESDNRERLVYRAEWEVIAPVIGDIAPVKGLLEGVIGLDVQMTQNSGGQGYFMTGYYRRADVLRFHGHLGVLNEYNNVID